MPRFSLPLTGEFPLSVYACIVSYTGTGTSISTSSYVLSAVSLWHLMSTIFSPFSFSGLFLLVFGVFVVDTESMLESLLVEDKVEDLDLIELRLPILDLVMSRGDRGEESPPWPWP